MIVMLSVVTAPDDEIRLVLERVDGARDRLDGLGETDEVEAVGVTLAVNLRHDVLVVVVPQSSRQLIVVHVRLALPLTPSPRHLVRVDELELALSTFPRDGTGVGTIRE